MRAKSLLRFWRRHLWFAGRGLHLLVAGPWSQPKRDRVHDLTKAMGYPERKHRPQLPSRPLRELVGDDVAVEVRAPWGHKWNVSVDELVAMNALVRHRQPAKLFEIGTFDGRTALNFHANAPAEAVIHTLDLPPGPETSGFVVGERFLGEVPEGRIEQLLGDSMTFDFAPYAGQIDLVFVDGSHRYEAVAADSTTALAMTAGRRALVLWHDYGKFRGVTRAVDELRDRLGPGDTLVHIADTSLACLLRG